MLRKDDLYDHPGPMSYSLMEMGIDVNEDGSLFLEKIDREASKAEQQRVRVSVRIEPDDAFALMLFFRLPHVRAFLFKAEKHRQHQRFLEAAEMKHEDDTFSIQSHNRTLNELAATKKELAELKARLNGVGHE